MVFITTVRPVDGEKLAKKINGERDRQIKEAVVPRKIQDKIQENPIKRNKFQID
ncbi:hypothetical protein LCGC14_2518260 [marine sediment metagenome]|uniref:Uncharacterized protein n=1 Tax=marine sediment metagenome TaxID=412755 RepID=A0A0F9D8Q3_9ZZZZ